VTKVDIYADASETLTHWVYHDTYSQVIVYSDNYLHHVDISDRKGDAVNMYVPFQIVILLHRFRSEQFPTDKQPF
jgi:hypothetical protein